MVIKPQKVISIAEEINPLWLWSFEELNISFIQLEGIPGRASICYYIALCCAIVLAVFKGVFTAVCVVWPTSLYIALEKNYFVKLCSLQIFCRSSPTPVLVSYLFHYFMLYLLGYADRGTVHFSNGICYFKEYTILKSHRVFLAWKLICVGICTSFLPSFNLAYCYMVHYNINIIYMLLDCTLYVRYEYVIPFGMSIREHGSQRVYKNLILITVYLY